MIQIVFYSAGGKTFPKKLLKPEYTFGNLPTCTFKLVHAPNIEPVHGKFLCDRAHQQVSVLNLSEKSPVLVNGEPLGLNETRLLKIDDIIMCCSRKWEIKADPDTPPQEHQIVDQIPSGPEPSSTHVSETQSSETQSLTQEPSSSPSMTSPKDVSPVPTTPVTELSPEKIATNAAPLEEIATSPPPIEQIATSSAPIEEIATNAAPIEEIATSSAPFEQIATNLTPIEEIATNSTPIEQIPITPVPSTESPTEKVVPECAASSLPDEPLKTQPLPPSPNQSPNKNNKGARGRRGGHNQSKPTSGTSLSGVLAAMEQYLEDFERLISESGQQEGVAKDFNVRPTQLEKGILNVKEVVEHLVQLSHRANDDLVKAEQVYANLQQLTQELPSVESATSSTAKTPTKTSATTTKTPTKNNRRARSSKSLPVTEQQDENQSNYNTPMTNPRFEFRRTAQRQSINPSLPLSETKPQNAHTTTKINGPTKTPDRHSPAGSPSRTFNRPTRAVRRGEPTPVGKIWREVKAGSLHEDPWDVERRLAREKMNQVAGLC